MTSPDSSPPSVVVDDGDGDDDDIVLPWWQNPRNIVTMLVAAILLAGMGGWLIGDQQSRVAYNDADVGFLQDMKAHHDQAIEMSLTYLGRPDTSPQLNQVARSIAFGQGVEAGVMLQMLRQWNEEQVSEEGQAHAWMGAPMRDEDMPGMASAEDLARLRAADGVDADRLFIELMVAHHRGGVDMAEAIVDLGRNDEVARLATSMARSQADEIVEMENLRPARDG